MKTTSITILFLLTSLIPMWGFQLEEMKNPHSPSSKMYQKVHQSLGAGKYDLAEAQLDSTLILAKEEGDTFNMGVVNEALMEINFLNNNLLKAKEYGLAAVDLIKNTDDSLRLSVIHSRLGSINIYNGQFNEARHYLKRAESYAVKKQKMNSFYINYIEWGNLYNRIGKPDSSIHYLLLLKDKILSDDTVKLSYTYSELSKTFLNVNNEERALEFANKALALIDGKKYKLSKARLETTKAHTLIKLQRYDEADALLNTDNPIFDNPRLTRYKENKNILRAKIALARSDYQLAESIISKINQSSFKDDLKPRIDIKIMNGQIALAKDNLQETSVILKKTKIELDKINHLDIELSYHVLASKYFQTVGDFKKATKALVAKEQIQDSLYNIQRINLAQNLEARYKRDQQDQKIATMSIREELTQARLTQQRWLIIGSLFLATIFAGLFFKFSQQNKKIKEQNNVISKALTEKEVLLKEIHHRVKNNLQVISSLLGLQSRKIKDKAALNAINEGRTRVQSMSLIHQNLYKENNLTGIEIKKYLEQLCNNLFATYNIANEQINLETNIEDIILDVDSIVPIGLILNELITNALKHAFPNNKSGIISIDISKNNEGLLMTVSDNGIGMKSDDPFNESNSFGYHLIKAFQRKLNADLDISGTNGTSISMLIRNYKIAA